MYLQRCLVVTWLVPRETAAISARSVCTIQPRTMPRHFMQNHIRRLHACLAVTCHLHFWQNDRELLRATVMTRWWNDDVGLNVLISRVWDGYRNILKSVSPAIVSGHGKR